MKSGASRRASSRQEGTRAEATEQDEAMRRGSAKRDARKQSAKSESTAQASSLIRDSNSAASDVEAGHFARLEAAVRALARSHALVRAENHALRGQLDARERQIAVLEVEASEIEGRRKHAIDRLDELIAEVEALESGANGEPPRKASGNVTSMSVASDASMNAPSSAGG